MRLAGVAVNLTITREQALATERLISDAIKAGTIAPDDERDLRDVLDTLRAPRRMPTPIVSSGDALARHAAAMAEAVRVGRDPQSVETAARPSFDADGREPA